MDVIVADSNRVDLRVITSGTLEVAYGEDENQITLECDKKDAPPEGGYVYVDGTEYGGIIDKIKSNTNRADARIVKCTGRSWHGVLAGKRLVPTSSSHIELSGTIEDSINQLINMMGLSSFFVAAQNQNEASCTVERFADGYSALREFARANDCKIAMSYQFGLVVIDAVPVEQPDADSDQIDFEIEHTNRCTNHLVCGGTGEEENRTVIHFYADAQGNVSHVQTFFGIDEITAFYDYSSADEEQLEEDGKKKLEEMQSQGSIAVNVHDDIRADIGDILCGRDNQTGLIVNAEIYKKIVKIVGDIASYSYEAGSPEEVSTSNSTINGSSGSSSSGGHSYYAGNGLTLTGWTFSADVANVSTIYPLQTSNNDGEVTLSIDLASAADANSWFSS